MCLLSLFPVSKKLKDVRWKVTILGNTAGGDLHGSRTALHHLPPPYAPCSSGPYLPHATHAVPLHVQTNDEVSRGLLRWWLWQRWRLQHVNYTDNGKSLRVLRLFICIEQSFLMCKIYTFDQYFRLEITNTYTTKRPVVWRTTLCEV